MVPNFFPLNTPLTLIFCFLCYDKKSKLERIKDAQGKQYKFYQNRYQMNDFCSYCKIWTFDSIEECCSSWSGISGTPPFNLVHKFKDNKGFIFKPSMLDTLVMQA